MKSFQYLNGVADAPVTYTDNRTSDVIFDRPAPKDYAFTDITYSFNVIVGTNIVELIGTPNVRYEINVGIDAATIPTTGWPDGITVLRVGNVYTFYGIDSVSKWNAVKSPLITLSNNFNGTVYYRATIVYDTGNQVNIRVGWEVGVFVPTALLISQSNMTIDPIATFGMDDTFVAGFTISKAILTKSGFTDTDPVDWLANTTDVQITTAPQLIYENTAGETWTVTVTPTNINIVDTITTTVTGGTQSFNNTTKQLTLTGTLTQVNYRLSNMVMTTLDVKEDFILEYSATSSAVELSGRTYLGSQIANCLNLDYLTEVRGTAYHTPGISSNIGSASPLVYDPDYTGDGNYVYTLSTSLPTYITNLTSTGIVRWGEIQSNGITDALYETDTEKGRQQPIALNSDSSVFAIASDDGYGKVELWKLSPIESGGSGEYVLLQTINSPDTTTTSQRFGENVRFASDDTLIITDAFAYPKPVNQLSYCQGRVHIFKRSGDTWSLDQTLIPTESSDYDNMYGQYMDVSIDGNLMIILNNNNQFGGSNPGEYLSADIWERTGGGSYSITQTITLGTSSFLIGTDVTVSGDGSKFAVGTFNTSSFTSVSKVYSKVSDTWTAGDAFGPLLFLSQTGNTLWTGIGTDSLTQYNYVDSAWVNAGNITLEDSLTVISQIELSQDNTTMFILDANENFLYEYDFDQALNTLTFVRTFDTSNYDTIRHLRTNNDGSIYIVDYQDPLTTNNAWSLNLYGPKPGEYNAGAGTLTITGTKAQVNQDIETITIQTPSGSLYNIPVNFSLLTPESNTDIKSTIVFRQI